MSFAISVAQQLTNTPAYIVNAAATHPLTTTALTIGATIVAQQQMRINYLRGYITANPSDPGVQVGLGTARVQQLKFVSKVATAATLTAVPLLQRFEKSASASLSNLGISIADRCKNPSWQSIIGNTLVTVGIAGTVAAAQHCASEIQERQSRINELSTGDFFPSHLKLPDIEKMQKYLQFLSQKNPDAFNRMMSTSWSQAISSEKKIITAFKAAKYLSYVGTAYLGARWIDLDVADWYARKWVCDGSEWVQKALWPDETPSVCGK